jgi:hypothetical protein
MARAAGYPKFRPDPPSQRESPIRGVMWPPLPPGFGILVRSDRSGAIRASGLPIIHPLIKRKPLAINHLAVPHDRLVDAGAALSIDQLDGLGHRVGIFSAVLHGFEAQGVPSICGLVAAFPASSLQICE